MIAILLGLALMSARPDPQAELTQGIVAFGRGDLRAARKNLDAAESHTTDPALLARIHRQKGIIDDVEGKRLSAVLSFLRAHYFDPKIELSEREHKGEVQRLFACARQLNQAGLSERAVEVRHGAAFQKADWKCPALQPEPPPSSPPPPPASPPPPPPPLATPPPPPPSRVEESSSVWSSPWLWIAVGAVVVAGGTTAGVLLAREEPYGGTSGVNIRLER